MPIALVVDDSMLIRHTVCRYLEDRGFQVESATNGVEALEMLKDLHPDIILTDIQMPKMDGYQLIQKLKSMSHTVSIPIVVLAGTKATKEQPEDTGADYVISKDFDLDTQLQQVLKKALDFGDAPA